MTDHKKRKWSPEARARLRAKYQEGVQEEPKEIELSKNTEDRYVAKRTFDYLDNVRVEAGEIVTLRGAPNDNKLVSLGYFTPWESDSSWEQTCLKCQKVFAHTSGYNNHVASHYQICAVCHRGIPDDRYVEHQQAHQELAAI